MPASRRLIVVSNRLPVVLTRTDGSLELHRGSGGLVTALEPVLRRRGGMWIGWSGLTEEPPEMDRVLKNATREAGYALRALTLSEQERDSFYYGYSNEVIWPLFHDLQGQANFDPEYEQVYHDVNMRYADLVARHGSREDFVWVHDYHLMYVGHGLNEMGFRGRKAFYLHIPFPALDIFLTLPDRHRVLRALLEYDLIGLQTARDRRNFIACVRRLLSDVQTASERGIHVLQTAGRSVRVGVFPIGIDFQDFAEGVESDAVNRHAMLLREGMPDRRLILGVDRLDYTKGIPFRLRAFQYLLERHPELHRGVTFVQVVVPSRADIPKYAALKTEIERLVGQINGQFAQPGWAPIHYVFRSLERAELLAHYRACDVALITPLKDGMNLVAKEYCAANVDETGVLILSEFAGAAAQLRRGAMLVTPYDVRGVAEAIHDALELSADERHMRMRRMRRVVRQQDVYWWVDAFLDAAFAVHLSDFPQVEEFIPEELYRPRDEGSPLP